MAPDSHAELEAHRAVLLGHCYRMLGSLVDAEDAVQETMIRAWRGLESFDGRSSLRTWLHRIATNVCLDALGDRPRRVRSIEDGPPGTVHDPLEDRPPSHWIEPIPDARVIPAEADPAEAAMLRENIRLAFVAALQHLAPKQRAALLLTEVVGFSAEEAAASLETSVASINSALQRARATLAAKPIDEPLRTLPEAQAELVNRYVAAFERYDVDGLTALLHHDATMSMPPHTLWLQGRDSIRAWYLGRGSHCQPSRMVATMACGSPAFGQYRAAPGGGYRAFALNVLELSDGRIAGTTHFLDVEVLFPAFGLAMVVE